MARRKAAAPAEPLSSREIAELERIHDRVICRRCGARKEQHGGATNPHRPFACPGGEFPKFPKLKDERKAGELFDKRLAAFWTKRSTSFSPAG